MKAAVTTAYGPPETVVLRRIEKPIPRRGEVLVKVKAATLTAGDARIRGLDVPYGYRLLLRIAFGWNRPRNPVQGWGFSGIVESANGLVEGLAMGQAVMGITGAKGGAHAEYVCVPADKVVPLPEGLSHDEGAAFFFGGLTAMDFLLDRAGLRPGENVLIHGATGAVGSAAVQMAHAMGAFTIASCSAANAGLARKLGADHVMDYRTDTLYGPYDVVMDVMGKIDPARLPTLMPNGGRLILVTADLPTSLGTVFRPTRNGIRAFAGPSTETPKAMKRLVNLYQSGSYRPLIGKVLPFDDIRRAHEIASSLHKAGNLVLRIE